MTGSIKHLSEIIKQEFEVMLPNQRKTQLEMLSLLTATMIQARTANTMELANLLPTETERLDMRYQRISRFLSNDLVDKNEIMHPFMQRIFKELIDSKARIVLMIDQSKVTDDLQLLMVSVRIGERALPVAWCIKITKGNIGFSDQKVILDTVVEYLPENAEVILMGDRFYGTPELISYCQEKNWDYRLRLKGNLLVFNGSEEATTNELVKKKVKYVENIYLTRARIKTNIGIIQEEGHPEPWIIAMAKKPNEYRTLDYGLRWGIESMFSDFKTRGFGLEDTQLLYPDRLERLILIMSLAMMWAVFQGAQEAISNPTPIEKKGDKKADRSKVSFFKRGVRYLQRCAQLLIYPPMLWINSSFNLVKRCFSVQLTN
jgi:DDE family transposase